MAARPNCEGPQPGEEKSSMSSLVLKHGEMLAGGGDDLDHRPKESKREDRIGPTPIEQSQADKWRSK